ncbi:hypothetical protein [Mycobacterium riyadhense]|uniref:hypothetical protein n=1 Tax=Mycobacterium riyadhense TaxID=486698 RepID=UPI00195894F8|nr:hypothetical protein [Mycobacterium riyadhense]
MTYVDLQPDPANRHRKDGQDTVRNSPSPVSGSRHWRKWLAAMLAVVSTWLVVGGVAVIFTAKHAKRAPTGNPTATTVTPLQEWWLQASDDFTELQHASVDVVQALRLNFPPALEPACLHLHDAAEVKLRARLPAPDPQLTADLRAAIEDFHSAAHMCLAIAAGSKTNYHGEFVAYLFLADRQMTVVQDRINKTLMRSV